MYKIRKSPYLLPPIFLFLPFLTFASCFISTLSGFILLMSCSIIIITIFIRGTSLVAQMVKRLPAMRETWVQSLGQEYPLEKEMATHSSTLAWKIPWM